MRNSVLGILVLLVTLSSCSVNKYIPEGQSLYVGSKVKVQADTITKPSVMGIASELEAIVKPPPNKTLLGFPWKVWWWYFIGEPKDEGGLRSWFRNKLGEQPKFATQRVADINAANMVSHLDNEAYYRSKATGKLVPSKKEKRRTAIYEFDAYVMPRYVMNEINYVVRDSSLFNRDLIIAKQKTLLKKGEPPRLEVISTERSRIDLELKGKGYYFFNPDYLIIKVDSTIGKRDSTLAPQQVNIFLEVKPQTAQTSLKQYFINKIYVNTGSQESLLADTTAAPEPRRRGLNIKDPGNLYKKRIFYDAIGFRRGNMYTNTMHNVSLQRLVNLQNFKFVKNQFDLVPRSDSALLDVRYDLEPLKKKALQTTISASTKSNNLGGSQLDVAWRNRNTFKGAEMLAIKAFFGFDVQLGGNREANPNRIGNEYVRYGIGADLSFPRFIIPFVRIRPEKSQALPKTVLSVNYENRVQRGLYTTTSIRGDWSYIWSKNSEVVHTLTPISINYIQPRKVNSEKLAAIGFSPNTNPIDFERLMNLVEQKYFIAGSNYTISYRPQPKPFGRNQFAFTGGIDYGGNLLSLLAKHSKDDTAKIYAKEFLKVPVFQYVKLDGDIRYYRTITPGIKWANRLLLGAIKPYGNSKDMATPQFKQYFGGGSTGIRAFRARALGPGAYTPDTATIALIGYQNFADIRMEFNSELRLKFTNIINGAVFMDAGNIWSFGSPERARYDSSALISSDFLKQIAVGGGIGLRLDFSYLIFRLDIATPFRKPWYTKEIASQTPEGEVTYKNPWVFNEVNFRSKAWRRENLILNIAVGLPF
ncbi:MULTISPECIES: translocation and assembly module lipoprotein TamL [Dyadobacter]|uniref:Outer membrane protein assembly factor n=1 Tax=Dyadobacter chenhuakuii TaxID=2909339 RepID=A0A9X1QII3_9BACT|nr:MULTISPECIES: BamA/TamA family outer membrane protein [Dyadobacter]MCE7071809.1 outer membrane protein assembly factor [Dyadobacter sp. CY327]MCF2496361.1 outer membrane protein assembly factor [Dyadobacter chenhuakuii]MCF2501102.1 outer membrane protein assembly factor [Dyadobacter chenhuakuii]USJ30421.1 outer membrane protein assembly factor [Dyadobacter chenhuakuii]